MQFDQLKRRDFITLLGAAAGDLSRKKKSASRRDELIAKGAINTGE